MGEAMPLPAAGTFNKLELLLDGGSSACEASITSLVVEGTVADAEMGVGLFRGGYLASAISNLTVSMRDCRGYR